MTESVIDLRSDTVTRPCENMKAAMLAAELGDDVYGEDPTINRLEQYTADVTGHQAALFFPSGTQSNLVALLSHCQRGDEYIVAQYAHTYKYEGGGAAVLGGIQPQPLERNGDGTIDLERIERAIKPDDIHHARTRVVALENTTTEGCAVALDYLADVRALCDRHDLVLHLDGARVFNAAAELDVEIQKITELFDSVSVCLSKGLGAPVGSVLCGSRALIQQALRWRKVVGGGMRQAGMLAAAGLYALQNNVARLGDDHALANYLAENLNLLPGIQVVGHKAHTNMVYFHLDDGDYDGLYRFARQNGVLFGGRDPVRMVTHKDVDREAIDTALNRLSGFFK